VIEAVGADADLARALWWFRHGMVINELNNRFPEDGDIDARPGTAASPRSDAKRGRVEASRRRPGSTASDVS
jgi:hypothetical protein